MATSQIVELYQPPRQRERQALEAGGAGLVIGWLIGRHHHPLVWAGLLAFSVGLVIALVMLWPYVIAAGVLVLGAHWRGHGRSWGRIGGTLAAMILAPVVILCTGLIGGGGLAIIIAAGLWATWHLAVKPRLHQLDNAHPRAL
jgi:hypothetical protein